MVTFSTMLRRLLTFFSPYLVVFFMLLIIAVHSGEFLPASVAARLNGLGYPFLYLPAFSDRNFQYKRYATILSNPDIVAIGSSRMNQWRSGMFYPYHFYNAGGALYVQEDYRRFLEALGDSPPKVVLFSLDSFTFDPNMDAIFKNRDYGNTVNPTIASYAVILKDVLIKLYNKPALAYQFHEPLYHLPALGMQALATGTGFRIDGSYQYGGVISGDSASAPQSEAQFVERVEKGIFPFLKRTDVASSKIDEFEKFVAYAKGKGITLVGITMPMMPEISAALNSSPSHGIWKEFQSREMEERLHRYGILYFNFTDIKSFGGKEYEFIDPIHPSEPAYIRMLLTMMEEPTFKALLSKVSVQHLREKLATGTALESFRNEF